MPSEHASEASLRRRRGRPVSAASRHAVLAAATALLDEHGLGGFSVDAVARRSGVSKATIYKQMKTLFSTSAKGY